MSAFFNESHIQQIIGSVNIVDLIGRYVALQPKGKEFVGLCPFHDDHKPSFTVSPVKQIFKCFSCGAGGDAIKFLMRREQMTFPEAVEHLADAVGIKLPQRRGGSPANGSERKSLVQLALWAAKSYREAFEQPEQGRKARDYVEQRQITEETARKFGIGWAPDQWDFLTQSATAGGEDIDGLVKIGLLVERENGGYYDRFRDRLIFPVIDALGRVIAFGGRTLGNDEAKYLNSPESVLFNKSRMLYGLHLAKDRIVKSRTAVVVEGYIDCVMAHQFGLDNVVATLGTALTAEHAKALARYAERIVLVFDADEAGQKAADRAVELFFSENLEVRLVRLPDGSDPSDYLLAHGREAFEKLLETATEALEYKWQVMLSEMEASDSVNGRKKAVETFLALIAKSFRAGHMNAIARGFILNRVAKLLERPPEEVHAQVDQLERRVQSRLSVSKDSQERYDEINTADGFVRAQQDVLEVLLNRPGLFDRVAEHVLATDFAEPRLAPIAELVWRYCEGGGEGGVQEMLAGCDDIALNDLATTLADRGAGRDNDEEILDGVIAYIETRKQKASRQKLREQLAGSGEALDDDAEAALLMAIQDKLQK